MLGVRRRRFEGASGQRASVGGQRRGPVRATRVKVFLRLGEYRGRPRNPSERSESLKSPRSGLQVAVEERDRHALNDRELWLLIGVRRQVFGTNQTEQVLRPRRGIEECVGEARRVDGVGRPLRGQ